MGGVLKWEGGDLVGGSGFIRWEASLISVCVCGGGGGV